MIHENKILIFTKNSAWGVKIHPQKGNIYKHVINFPTNKKNEFVDNYLCETGSSFDAEWNTLQFAAYHINWLDEFRFTFKTNLDQQGFRFNTLEELSMSDIAATKDAAGNRYYWAIKVIHRTKLLITFECQLDIFFTYDIKPNMFYPNASNYVSQAHVNRYNANGSLKWENILRNNLEIPATKQEIVPIYRLNNSTDWENYVKRIDKWVFIYVLNTGKDLENFFKAIGITDTNNYPVDAGRTQHWPYTCLIFPISQAYDIYTANCTLSNQYILTEILHKCASYIMKVEVFNHIGIGDKSLGDIFTGTFTQPILGDPNVWTNIKIKLRPSISPISTTTIKKVSNFANQGEHNIQFFYVSNLSKAVPEKLTINKGDIFTTTNSGKDPIIYHPSIFQLKLSMWNGESKDYSLHRIMLDTQKWNVINVLNEFSPEEDGAIAWIEENGKYQEDKLLNSNFLNMGSGASLPIIKTALSEYMKNSGNSWRTRKNYDIQQGKTNIITSSIGAGLGLIGSIGSAVASSGASAIGGAAAGTFGAGVGIANSVISYNRNAAMRKSHIKDLENQTPNTTLGVSINKEIILNNLWSNDPIKLDDSNGSSKLKLSKYTLTKGQEEMLLDKINIFGYDVNENKKISKLINTRKRFNYIECNDIFESIKLKLSANIKQIINGAFQDGITIWHYRNKDDWKGIISYDEKDNDEV